MNNIIKFLDKAVPMTLALALAVIVAVVPEASLAGAPSITSTFGTAEAQGISTAVCNVIGALQGDVVRAIAAFGIIFLGFSLFLGKISWGVGLALAIGLGAVLGAGQIVGVISGSNMECEPGTT